MALSIMAHSIMAFSITIKNAIFSIMALSITIKNGTTSICDRQ